MKIAHLISSNGLFGAERVMLNLAASMNKDGVESWIIAVKNEHNPHLEVVGEAERIKIPVTAVQSKGRFDFKAVAQLADFIKQTGIDIIHTHNYKANFLGFLAARKAKIPIVATLHGYLGKGLKLRFYEWLDRILVRSFDKVIFVDESLRKYFRKRDARYAVINNGVPVGARHAVPLRNGAGLVIGTVGRLSQEKGQRYLLEAFALLKNSHPNLRLIIVGDGDLRNQLEDQSRHLRIKDQVDFVGYQRDVREFYEKMDIYVSSSLVEHFPVAIMEAMSYGLPVAATRVGGTAVLVKEGVTGILIRPRSIEDICQAVSLLLKDSTLREKLRVNARKMVEMEYSLERMVAGYQEVYSRI